MAFEYNHQEPMILTDLKNKYFKNFYNFLTSAYNYYDEEYLSEYNTDDIRIAEPKRDSNRIPYELAYNLANSMVDDMRDVFKHFKVTTVPNAPYSQEAPDPIVWGPALPY